MKTAVLPSLAALALAAALIPGSVAQARPRPARPGDYDGDGRRDIAVTLERARTHKSAILVYSGGARKVSRRPAVIRRPKTTGHFTALATGDFDGDGYADLAALLEREPVPGDVQGGLVVYSGSRKGLGRTARTLLSWGAAGNAAPVAADLTGDGRADLVAARPTGPDGGHLDVRLGTGRDFGLPLAPIPFKGSFTVGDVTGDGRADVVVASGSRTLRVIRGTRAGLDTGHVKTVKTSAFGAKAIDAQDMVVQNPVGGAAKELLIPDSAAPNLWVVPVTRPKAAQRLPVPLSGLLGEGTARP
ncbi:VCBS repeat-containing protein [Actinocorallia libanotica]|uniref:VCBS repeat protein n=1 Tax=Actinocorallia libanotica TaxID=46162 RepID=A0ABN1RPV7_9ACTN